MIRIDHDSDDHDLALITPDDHDIEYVGVRRATRYCHESDAEASLAL